MDALLNDDYHHTAFVALTGRREAYYTDYTGTPQELISSVKHGFLFQGQWYSWQKQRRGTPTLDLPPTAFVHFLENHDQVANSALGKRVHQLASPGRWRAMTALTLLGPATPLLFQGQEFAASSPFLFFVDHTDALREPIRDGRAAFLSQFPSVEEAARLGALPVPDDPETFHRSRLDWTERETHTEAVALHRDLLRIRREDPAIAGAASNRRAIEGAVLAPRAFLIRYESADGNDRLLIVNLEGDLDLTPLPEPLLAPPLGCDWIMQWHSEAFEYGGSGRAPLQTHPAWHVMGESALLLRAGTEPNAE
jgi:maltooligosyltrehalose trehalohydrolase